MDHNEQYQALSERPDIEEAQARYEGLLSTIRDQLVAEFGIAEWKPPASPVRGSACGPDFTDIDADGEIRRLSSGSSPGNLPDERWTAAVTLVAETARGLGFGDPEVVVDRQQDHEVSLKDEYGAELLFGTAANTTLSISTGCHLTKAAKERGAPA
ncbi:LppA family lipoprotein [Actinokineospora pegani]|uniref:LppA family lipoprotein n=1 Tax=Actinokineospora pegani TaxID=2654637 RepID=UPI001F404D2A|nr:LppA family lipoprotein [Actinokineospora pegani]